MTNKFRKKPVVIEALQYLREDNISSVQDFVGKYLKYFAEQNEYAIETLEGTSYFLVKGDWIIKGVNGEFYPCKPDIFEKTYDSVSLDDGQEGEGLAIEFYKWAENLSPSERCTVHAPAGSGAGTGVYVLSTEELYDKYLDYKNRASQTTLTTALPVGDGEGEKVDGMRELFKLVWLDGFHGVARDMENDLTRRLALLPSAVTGGVKWVSVGERLPEEDVDVIGFFPDKTEGGEYVAMAIRSGNKLHSAFPNSTAAWFEATHWMSLPPHPSEGQPAQE